MIHASEIDFVIRGNMPKTTYKKVMTRRTRSTTSAASLSLIMEFAGLGLRSFPFSGWAKLLSAFRESSFRHIPSLLVLDPVRPTSSAELSLRVRLDSWPSLPDGISLVRWEYSVVSLCSVLVA